MNAVLGTFDVTDTLTVWFLVGAGLSTDAEQIAGGAVVGALVGETPVVGGATEATVVGVPAPPGRVVGDDAAGTLEVVVLVMVVDDELVVVEEATLPDASPRTDVVVEVPEATEVFFFLEPDEASKPTMITKASTAAAIPNHRLR